MKKTKGMLLVWGLNIVQIAAGVALMNFRVGPIEGIANALAGGFGVTQLFYVVPLMVRFHREGKSELETGVAIGAAASFACSVAFVGILYFVFGG